MEFLYPNFLWALTALAIPIIIHLFNFRRFRKVVFPNVRFLHEIKEQTQSQSKLRKILVLLARMLAITFLVFAFAQPVIPENDSRVTAGRKSISVYIDNSFSMEAEGEEGPLLEQARQRAREIAAAHSPNDRFQLLTNEFSGKQQRWLSRDAFIEATDNITLSPEARQTTEVLARQRDLFTPSDEGTFRSYLVSDFQQSLTNLQQARADSIYPTTLLPLNAPARKNLSIDSVWFESPLRRAGEQDVIRIRVRNAGEQNLQKVPLRLSVGDMQKAITNFDIDAGTSLDTALYFNHGNAGIAQATLSITDHPITFDDDFYISYRVTDLVRILAISPDSKPQGWRNYLEPVFGEDPQYELKSANLSSVDYQSLNTFNTIVLYELPALPSGLRLELEKFMNNGGSVCVIPSENAETGSYNNLLQKANLGRLSAAQSQEVEASRIDTEHPLYRGVFQKIPRNIDLPQAQRYYPINFGVRSNASDVLAFRNGYPLLATSQSQSGRTYAFAVPLNSDNNNLAEHAIFVTSMLRIAELSMPYQQLYTVIGSGDPIRLANVETGAEDVLTLRRSGNEEETIPEKRTNQGNTLLYPHDQIEEAGNYLVELGDSTLSGIGFNYSRKESDVRTYSREELEASIESNGLFNYSVIEPTSGRVAEAVETLSSGETLWKLCVLLALGFLFVEILLLRFWKT